MIFLQNLVDTLRATAIADLFSPTEQSVWRRFCRIYSKTFHTPLHQVLLMEPEEVILAVVESQIESADLDEHAEQLLEMIYSIEDPEYEILKKKELEEIDKKILEEEEARLREGRPIHSSLKSKAQSAKKDKDPGPKPADSPLPDSLPKSGGINLSYLEAEDSKEAGDFE